MAEEAPWVIIDTSSTHVHVGYLGEESPAQSIETKGVEKGVIKDFKAVGGAWSKFLKKAKSELDSKELYVLASESPDNTSTARAKTVETLFGVSGVTAVLIVPSPLLTLYSYGKQTGAVIEIRSDSLNIAAIHQGKIQGKIFSKTFDKLNTDANFVQEIATQVKNVVTAAGDEKLQEQLYRTILLGGEGSTKDSLKKDIQTEVKKVSGVEYVTVFGTPNRKHSTWLGGSQLAENPVVDQLKVTSTEFKKDANIISSRFKY
eukprot:TRINITY_DN19504_c0_g1_i1.p1 TRINITY_DN19504_c0_g1~~TRINITY_DN19504_c0_g1_i1.p1  ORF type:complete len:260 (-),score=74.58 TRINITY_DN19504_c0_g1_i1:35-814(-)